MSFIRANRESIDDRFSVLGFTVRTDTPLFEIGLATDPELLKAENRTKRTSNNFFSSSLLGASRQRDGDSVYLVPPNVVARFAGQSKLYFGLATYQEGNRSRPIEVRIPDRGRMYVNLSGLTERGLRRTVRLDNGNGYGSGSSGNGLQWGGDAVASAASPVAGNGAGNRANAPAAATPNQPAPYNDGYSDELWKQSSTSTPPAATVAPALAPSAAAPIASPTPTNGGGEPHLTTSQSYSPSYNDRQLRNQSSAQAYAKPLLVEPYNSPSSWWDNLTTQIGHFARGAMWFLGVTDTTQPPFSAICQVRKPDGSAEGAHLGTAFFIGPRLLLTAAHVVDGESELIIVPGKNGAGTGRANEPFGRFRVTQFRKHGSYGANGEDNDMALICVPAANAASAPNYFGLVEELTQSRPEGVVVSGYAAWWHATSTIEEYVNKNIDENRQHAHGGYIRELPTDGTFTYDLQTLAGTSGSPVYWIEGGAQPVAHLVGVHVAANDNRTNLGCRITQEKLTWIRQTAASWGQALTFSLGVRALEEAVGVDDNDDPEIYGITGTEPENAEALVAAQGYAVRGLDAPQPDYPGASRFAAAHANNFRVGRKNNTAVDRIVIHITAGGPKIGGTIAWFQNGNRINERTGKRIQSSAHYIVGRDGEVVQMVRNADTAWHASQVNSRSIGIEHNANKPSRGNPRDLPPTEAQYEASARLVAWLCQQYGLPADRDHIVGHMEASPRDNHDCPSSYWDWDHYMACVQIAASQLSAAPATSQGVRALGSVAHALDIITPYYDPADPASALVCQADAFSLAREEWFAGVPNTTIFPHSAICLLEMKNASGAVASRGTGFYIGPNRILTCGHNLFDANYTSVDVIPGKNGQGAGTEPFGRFNVPRSQWRIPTSYGGTNPAYDLAVIDNVPNSAPGGQWFDVLEELNQSRPEGVVVCGYSSRSPRVPELTAAIDGFKQHLHAGYIAALGPGDSTFDYPILTLKRASGSPVYYISNKGGANKAYIVGVHTGGATDDLNRGCRLTTAKIDWIEGRTASLSLGYGGARGLDAAVDDDASRGIEGPIPDDVATSQSLAAVGRALSAPSPEYPQASRFVPADSGNYRTSTSPRTIERVVIHITDGGANINGTVGWFQNPAAKVSAHYVIGQNGEVVQMVRHNDVAWHARSANGNSIGIEHVANARGLNPTPAQMCASAALVTWLCDTYGIPVDRTHVLGHSEADTKTTHTGCPNAVWNWTYYMGLVNSRTCYAPDAATTTAQGYYSPRALEIPLDPGIGGQSIGLEALSPGDIIVSTARAAVSYAIRAGTLSAVSHAMIYVGGGNIVEAVGDGVREVPLATAIGDAILAVAYRDPRLDAARAAVLVNFARAQVGQPYNYGGVVRIGHRILFPLQSRLIDAIRSLTGTDSTSAGSFFCSELVFAAFEAAGIALVAAPAGDGTPGDLVALTRGSLGYVGHLKARDEFLGIALGLSSRAQSFQGASALAGGSDYPVHLIPQLDKNSCWAASMAMLYSFRRNMSLTPETLANDVGASLATSYGWDLLKAVRDRYGFEMIRQPDNTSLYHSPQQWADWLATYGPLWVVIVGAPHAVVLAGISGELADPNSVKVKILNPWDTRVAFDNDAVTFNPRNSGYEDWLSFNQFASDFGNMAESNYGNWRVLHLPVSAANAQSLGLAGTGVVSRAQNALVAVVAEKVLEKIVERVMTPAERGRITARWSEFSGWYHPGGAAVNVATSAPRALSLANRPLMFDPPDLPMPFGPGLSLLPNSANYQQMETHTSDGGFVTPDFNAGDYPAQYQTFQEFMIRWASDGASVGLISIEPGERKAAEDTQLDVTAQIQPQPGLTPGGYASVHIVFFYRFTDHRGDEHAAEWRVRLFGNGTSNAQFAWTHR
ncbi:N-acetylmuramoyl-L-alanine amidase [Lysobacter fragariae]